MNVTIKIRIIMKVYLLKDVSKVGFAGELLKVSDGYATNFLFPRKLAVQVTSANENYYKSRVKTVEDRKSALESKSSMLAEKIKGLNLTLSRKLHDGDKLYASVSSGEVVELLAKEGVSISKSQVVFDKAIKTKGRHTLTIKLSSKLQPKVTLKVVPEAE
jgi:large subunit ribosomal protein L9